MKKCQIKAKQIIAGSLASIILIQSCTKSSVNYYYSEDIDYINTNNNDYENSILLPIDISIDSQVGTYLDFLNELASNIIQNPMIAQDFLMNPDNYIYSHGYSNIHINMDDALLNMVLCLADEELNSSIKNNDVASFVHICNRKGYIKAVNDYDVKLVKKLLENNPEIVQLVKQFDGTDNDLKIESEAGVAFAAVLVVGVVAFIWAVAVTHAGVVNAALAGTVFAYEAAYTWSTIGEEPLPPVSKGNNGSIHDANKLIKLWLLKGGDSVHCEMITNLNNEIYVEQLIEAIQKELPEIGETVDINLLKKNIMLNINI